tara:strand:- start:132 stop:407 length:276 start_codon:yes stop_codon:yes gene_type:complete
VRRLEPAVGRAGRRVGRAAKLVRRVESAQLLRGAEGHVKGVAAAVAVGAAAAAAAAAGAPVAAAAGGVSRHRVERAEGLVAAVARGAAARS